MGAPSPPSAIWSLAVDDALQQDADFRDDPVYRAYVDSQVRGLQRIVVDALARGTAATYLRADAGYSAPAVGDVVCPALDSAGERACKLATSAAVAAAGSVCGVVVSVSGPGGRLLVARGGLLPPTVTGLATGGTRRYVRASSVGRCEAVAAIQPGDAAIGTVDANGTLVVVPSAVTLSPGLVGAAPAPIGLTITGAGHVDSTVVCPAGTWFRLVDVETGAGGNGGAISVGTPSDATALVAPGDTIDTVIGIQPCPQSRVKSSATLVSASAVRLTYTGAGTVYATLYPVILGS